MITDYKKLYISYCENLNDCATKEEVKKHNAAMRELGRLFHRVEKENDKSFLLDLLKNDDGQTRSLVAAHCLGLGVYVSEAKKVLRVLSKDKSNPVLAFNAQATLDVWKKQGRLDF